VKIEARRSIGVICMSPSHPGPPSASASARAADASWSSQSSEPVEEEAFGQAKSSG
jgi:hypothetical protein